MVIGEENLTMLDDRHYSQENILIHEFAHSVMCIGMDDEQRQSICGAYEEAVQSRLYQPHIYMMANADEYWAEATQSWFDATVRTGTSTATAVCCDHQLCNMTCCNCIKPRNRCLVDCTRTLFCATGTPYNLFYYASHMCQHSTDALIACC